MKYIKLFLTTLVFTLIISSTVFAFGNTPWDVSGTYYDRIGKYDYSISTSAKTTYGTCTLYVNTGSKYSININPKFGDGTGSKAVSFKNNRDGFYAADDNTNYKGHTGWQSLNNIKFDGTPTTWLLCVNKTNADFGGHLNSYYYNRGYTSAKLFNECDVRVTVYVRQNPSTCSQNT